MFDFEPKELRETLPSPLYNVKHLKAIIVIPPPSTKYEIGELLDGLLWISTLPELLVIESFCHESNPNFDKLSFEVLTFSFFLESSILLFMFSLVANEGAK